MRRSIVILLFATVLSACGASSRDQAPGGVPESDARALNDAAAMLDNDSVSAGAIGADQPETNQ